MRVRAERRRTICNQYQRSARLCDSRYGAYPEFPLSAFISRPGSLGSGGVSIDAARFARVIPSGVRQSDLHCCGLSLDLASRRPRAFRSPTRLRRRVCAPAHLFGVCPCCALSCSGAVSTRQAHTGRLLLDGAIVATGHFRCDDRLKSGTARGAVTHTPLGGSVAQCRPMKLSSPSFHLRRASVCVEYVERVCVLSSQRIHVRGQMACAWRLYRSP